MSNGILKLREASALTPAATGAPTEWATQIGEAMREAITADDVGEIMKGVVKKAKEGDAKAIQQVLDFVGRSQPNRGQVVIGVRGVSAGGGPNGNGHAPRVIEPDEVRAETVSPDRTIAVEMAQALGRFGPLADADLADKAGYTQVDVARIAAANGTGTLNAWFSRNSDFRLRLTACGRKDLLGG